jgi:hypothetical protein
MTDTANPIRASLFAAAIIGVGAFAVSTICDALLWGLKLNPLWSMVDDLALGIFVGAVVLVYDWRRRYDLHRKLSAIHEINHHVRNALEVIEYSAWATRDQQHIARIQESVQHIEWALREILGAQEQEAEEQSEITPPAKPPQSVPPLSSKARHGSD